MVKRIICLGVMLIMIFSLGACENYGFKEKKTNDMIEFPITYWNFAISAWGGGYPIRLKCSDENAVFECSVDEGYFFNDNDQMARDKSVIVKSNERIQWSPEHVSYEIKQVFIEISLKIDNNIIGYAIVKIFEDNETYKGKLLKSALIPKINGEYQNVTEEQIKNVMEKIKK